MKASLSPEAALVPALDEEGNSVRPLGSLSHLKHSGGALTYRTVRLGDVDELERLVGDVDGHRPAGGVGDELAQRGEVVVQA
jgi:hypothetical protein